MHPLDGRDQTRSSLVARERLRWTANINAPVHARRFDAGHRAVRTMIQNVLCCDPFEASAVFDAWFADGSERTGGVLLRRRGAVARSVAYALDALHDDLPAVVLVHENLPGTTPGGPGDGALELVRALAHRFGPAQRPPCVLVTGRLHPPEVQRFCLAGGAHVIDWSTQSCPERRAILRAAARGERWRHAPHPPTIEFTPRDLDLLPCLEADLSPNEVARTLGLSDQQVHDSRRALYARLVRANAVDFVLAGHTTALAAAALRAGAIWEPLG